MVTWARRDRFAASLVSDRGIQSIGTVGSDGSGDRNRNEPVEERGRRHRGRGVFTHALFASVGLCQRSP